MKPSKQRRLKTQLLRHRQVEVVDRRDRQEDDHVDRDVEEDLVQNVDVEVVVDEVREVDLLQLSKTMSKRTMKLAKSVLVVDAKRCHLEDAGLVEEADVEEVGEKMVMMCRCGWGGSSLLANRGEPGVAMALLPC